MHENPSAEQLNAWLDRQTTGIEREAIESEMTEALATRMAAEERLESALGSVMGQDVPCPDTTWARIRREIDAAKRPQASVPARRSPVYYLSGLAAAALVLLVAGLAVLQTGGTGSSANPLVPAESVAQLATRAETDPTWEAMRAFLDDHEMRVELSGYDDMYPASGRDVRVLGARMVDDSHMAELAFNCCGFPVSLLIAEDKTAEADAIREAARNGTLQGMRAVNGYVLAVVSKREHPATEFLRLAKPIQSA